MKAFAIARHALALGAFGLTLAAGSIAIANIALREAFESAITYDDFDDRADEAVLPLPVIGNGLFLLQSGQNPCMRRKSVIAQFKADRRKIGGRTVEIVRGRDQEFSNLWRDRIGAARFIVSGVVAHLFFDQRQDHWTADLVEFDEAGCAMSRTLMQTSDVAELLAETNRAQ
jgi:hypothetical protein